MNNQNDNQTNPPTSDQDVLNKYASSIKPNTVEVPPKTIFSQDLDDTNDNSLEVKMSEAPKTTPLLDPPFVPQPQPSEKPLDSIPPQSTETTYPEVKESLNEFNSTPIDTPTPTSLSDNLEPSKSLIDESSSVIENEPEFKPEPELEPIIQTETNSLTTPQEDPEIIKQKIEEVLSYTTASNIVNSTSDKPKTSGFLKTLFFLSLFIFIGVVGVLGYFITNPVSKTNSDPKTTINPTTVPTQTGVTCELNGFIYTQGQSFPSADGCNTCTCVSVDNVTCTEKACADNTKIPTTTIIPATQSATPAISTNSSNRNTTPTVTKVENKN